jgi:hypothetical protein
MQRILKQRGLAGQHPNDGGRDHRGSGSRRAGMEPGANTLRLGWATAANAAANDAMPWAVPAPVRASRFGARMRPSFNNGDQHVK